MALTEEQQFKARVIAQEHITLFLINAINQLAPSSGLIPALAKMLDKSVPTMQLDGAEADFSSEFKAEVLRSGHALISAASNMKP